MAEHYYDAQIQLARVVEKLDAPGVPLRDRVEAATNDAMLLGRMGVTIPRSIHPEVEAMRERIAKWILPGTVNAIGSAVAWMDEAELASQEAEFRRWAAVVRQANDQS